jgi:hypothetical protein
VNEDRKQSAQKALKEFGIPVVAGVVAAGAGILWRRKPDLRGAVPDMKGGVGDLMDDLRGKVEAVGNKSGTGTSTKPSREADKRDEFAERRKAREQRRNDRRNQSGR